MIRKHDPGCRCCDTCGDATINAGPYTCGATTYTVLFELLDASGTVLQTHTGTTASFTAPGATTYKLRVSGTGIHTKTSSTFTPGCGTTVSAGPTTWPTSFTQTGNVRIYDISGNYCPLAGTTVAASGDGTSGSGVTDSAGNYSFAVSTSSTTYPGTITLTATPPSGTGADATAISVSNDPCFPTPRNIALSPDADHVEIICNYKYMPLLMHGEDDYGGADATFDGGASWVAHYIYESSHCIKEIDCGGVPTYVADQTGDVRVTIQLTVDDSFSCSGRTFVCYRVPNFTSAPIDCTPTFLTKCQPVVGPDWPAIYPGYFSETEASCDSAVSIEFAIPALVYPPADDCTVEETEVSVTWTGTI